MGFVGFALGALVVWVLSAVGLVVAMLEAEVINEGVKFEPADPEYRTACYHCRYCGAAGIVDTDMVNSGGFMHHCP